MSVLIYFVDLLQPIVQFAQICVYVGLIFYIVNSLTKNFDVPLAILLAGCFISLFAVSVWFIFGLQTE